MKVANIVLGIVLLGAVILWCYQQYKWENACALLKEEMVHRNDERKMNKLILDISLSTGTLMVDINRLHIKEEK